jgi:ComF family protein
VIIREALDALTAILFPAPCRICAQPLTNASRVPIRETCLSSFERIVEPMCKCCGRPFSVAPSAQSLPPLCRLCRADLYGFSHARSFAIYNDALGAAIVLLKYEEVRRLGDWFAKQLADTLAKYGEGFRPDVIVPVPLHPERQRERGYNQADLIARPLAGHLGVKLRADMLVRTRPRPAQLVLSRTERWKAVRGAYATREGARVDKLRILLVDDVMTTGATLDACARALRKAGAAEIFGLTVARLVPGWSPSIPPQQRGQQ